MPAIPTDLVMLAAVVDQGAISQVDPVGVVNGDELAAGSAVVLIGRQVGWMGVDPGGNVRI